MEKKYSHIRRVCQFLFLGTTLLIGVRFYQFAVPLEQGMIPDVQRPPGVEAFLPISALVSLKHFALTHGINEIHPSGLLILLFPEYLLLLDRILQILLLHFRSIL